MLAEKKLSKAKETVEAQQKVILDAQAALVQLQEKEATLQREVAALGEELRRTMPDAGRSPVIDLTLDQQVLDAHPEVKAMVHNPAFEQFKKLYEQAATARAPPPSAESGPAEPASPGEGDAPMGMDGLSAEDVDKLFAATGGQGDKRAFEARLQELGVKRPRLAQPAQDPGQQPG